MNKLYYLIILFLTKITTIKAQEFINGDLDGIIINLSSLPPNWLNVPYGDVNCLATSFGGATPDLTSLTLPMPLLGIIGNPYSGNTFVSGTFAYSTSSLTFWQEGIMQTVSGFIPGNTYPINFHQAVVKQTGCLDPTGSWAVYIDTILAGITLPTYSSAPFNSTSFVWESRTITFIATAISHTIKFLPIDDDSLWNVEDSTALRMGIDCIYISNACNNVNTGIDDTENEELALFPNPFTDRMNITTKTNELVEVNFYDVTARKIFNQSFTNSISINTEHLAKGVYLYEVRNKNGVIKKGKVVKD